MVKNKSASTLSKKRKVDEGGDVGEGDPKKARLASSAPTAYVKLPHSPRGSLHGISAEPVTDDKRLDQHGDNSMEANEADLSQAGPSLPDTRRAKKTAGRRERRARAKEGYLRAKAEGADEPIVSSIIKSQAQKRREARAREEQAEMERAARKAAKKEKKRVRAAMIEEQDQMRGEAEALVGEVKDEEERVRREVEQRREGLVVRVDKSDDRSDAGQSAWVLSAPSAGQFVDRDPIFVRDPESGEEFLITANQREVQLLSLKNSLSVRTCLVPDGSIIRCLAPKPYNESDIWIACTNGHLYSWTWTLDDPAVRKSDFESGVWAMVDSAEDKLFSVNKGRKSVLLNGTSLFDTRHPLQDLHVLGDAEYIVALGKHAVIIGRKNESQTNKQNGPTYTFIDLPLNEGATCLDTRLAVVANSDRRDPKRQQVLSVAIGNMEGQILLYDDILSIFAKQGKSNSLSPRVLHWHRQKVGAIKFSRDGNYLISGGEETVLVLWQLGTGKKQFLPHLMSEIKKIVVNLEGDKYALQMGDNSIMVLSTSELKPIANFAGLQLIRPTAQSAGKNMKAANPARTAAAAVIHPQNSHQLLLSVPSTQPKSDNEAAVARPFLQTFDVNTSRHVARQALARNNVTDFNLGPERTPIAPPDVGLLAISHDGQSLATVDEWMPPVPDVSYLSSNDGASIDALRAIRREVFLKFWRWDEAQGLWTLSTRVAAPHGRTEAEKGARGAGTVFQLVAESEVMAAAAGFATVGEDGVVKLWKPRTRRRSGIAVKTTSGNEGVDGMVEWSCKRAIELPAYNATAVERVDSPLFAPTSALESNAAIAASSTSTPPICLAFSADGSILAAIQNPPGPSENRLPILHLIDTRTGNITRTQYISEVVSSSTYKGQSYPVVVEAVAFIDPFLVIAARGVVLVYDLVANCALRRRFPIPIRHGAITKLAVDHVEGTFAVAVGAKVSVFDPKAMEVEFKTRSGDGTKVVAILSSPAKKGYTLVMEDATVRRLTSTGLGRRLPLPPTPPPPPKETLGFDSSTGSMKEQEAQISDALALCAATEKEEEEEEDGPVEPEDDRPVVQPEQLAEIFDGAQSFALPPVQDMYRAVAQLFGRKPLRLKGVIEDVGAAVM